MVQPPLTADLTKRSGCSCRELLARTAPAAPAVAALASSAVLRKWRRLCASAALPELTELAG